MIFSLEEQGKALGTPMNSNNFDIECVSDENFLSNFCKLKMNLDYGRNSS